MIVWFLQTDVPASLNLILMVVPYPGLRLESLAAAAAAAAIAAEPQPQTGVRFEHRSYFSTHNPDFVQFGAKRPKTLEFYFENVVLKNTKTLHPLVNLKTLKLNLRDIKLN